MAILDGPLRMVWLVNFKFIKCDAAIERIWKNNA